LYIQAETGRLPELKRVIVASGDRVIMAESLEQALAGLERAPTAPPEEPRPPEEPLPPETRGIRELALSALEHYERARQYLQQGDWAGYGAELEAMQSDLEALAAATE
jgi:hypothetical protein